MHLRLNELTIQFPNRTSPTLSGVDLSVGSGECHCIVGPTGSGKSSLLLAVAGLLSPKACSGTIERAARPGSVFQNPQTQILCDTVGPETAFALENHGVAPEEMPALVQHALEAANLDVAPHTTTASLSMGRQYRLVLAGALVTLPDLLLLDEPCAQLDPAGCRAVARVIDNVLARGGSVLLCEHEPGPLADSISHWWRIEANALCPATPGASSRPMADDTEAPSEAVSASGSSPLLNIRGLSVKRGDTQVFQDLDLVVRRGEAIHVEGRNGSGKSTLTRIMAGFLKPDSGTVSLLGAPVSTKRLRGNVGLVLQTPASQLFEDTVLRELSFAARRKRLLHAEVRARHVAELLGIAALLDRPPSCSAMANNDWWPWVPA